MRYRKSAGELLRERFRELGLSTPRLPRVETNNPPPEEEENGEDGDAGISGRVGLEEVDAAISYLDDTLRTSAELSSTPLAKRRISWVQSDGTTAGAPPRPDNREQFATTRTQSSSSSGSTQGNKEKVRYSNAVTRASDPALFTVAGGSAGRKPRDPTCPEDDAVLRAPTTLHFATSQLRSSAASTPKNRLSTRGGSAAHSRNTTPARNTTGAATKRAAAPATAPPPGSAASRAHLRAASASRAHAARLRRPLYYYPDSVSAEDLHLQHRGDLPITARQHEEFAADVRQNFQSLESQSSQLNKSVESFQQTALRVEKENEESFSKVFAACDAVNEVLDVQEENWKTDLAKEKELLGAKVDRSLSAFSELLCDKLDMMARKIAALDGEIQNVRKEGVRAQADCEELVLGERKARDADLRKVWTEIEKGKKESAAREAEARELWGVCKTLERKLLEQDQKFREFVTDVALKLEKHLAEKQENSQENFSKSVWNLLRRYENMMVQQQTKMLEFKRTRIAEMDRRFLQLERAISENRHAFEDAHYKKSFYRKDHGGGAGVAAHNSGEFASTSGAPPGDLHSPSDKVRDFRPGSGLSPRIGFGLSPGPRKPGDSTTTSAIGTSFFGGSGSASFTRRRLGGEYETRRSSLFHGKPPMFTKDKHSLLDSSAEAGVRGLFYPAEERGEGKEQSSEAR